MAVRYHWQDGDENTDLVPPPAPRRPGLARAALIAGGLVTAALIVAGALIWKRAQAGLHTAQSDLQAVISAEAAALQRGDEEVYLSLQDFNHRQWYRDQQLYWGNWPQ